jgi:ATP-dependent Lhr-like helicase
MVGGRRLQSLLVEKVNGVSVLDPGANDRLSTVRDALTGSGFARTPRGLRLR